MAARKLKLAHPGKILREEFMEPVGLSAYALAKSRDVPLPRVNDIVREKRAISPEMAVLLSAYFGTTDGYWINLQAHYDLEMAKDPGGQARRANTAAPARRARCFAADLSSFGASYGVPLFECDEADICRGVVRPRQHARRLLSCRIIPADVPSVGGRSVFQILLRLPDGRAATLMQGLVGAYELTEFDN